MKLIVGLGNPGEKYKNTRHNVGFLVVDELGSIRSLKFARGLKSKGYSSLTTINSKGEEILLVKPQEFMNKSGVVLKRVVKNFSGSLKEDLIVIHDDLDIDLGKYKISEKGPKDHNGVNSIYEQVGKDFIHVRVGINARHLPGKVSKENQRLKGIRPSGIGISGKDYVLGNWKPEERDILNKVIEEIIEELKNVLT